MAVAIAVAPWRDAMNMAEIAGCFRFLHQPSSIAAVSRAARRAAQRAARLCSLNTAAHHLLTLLVRAPFSLLVCSYLFLSSLPCYPFFLNNQ
ncbi:hypothetical protein S83_014828 [Arachis hypogaea]